MLKDIFMALSENQRIKWGSKKIWFKNGCSTCSSWNELLKKQSKVLKNLMP